MKRITCIPPRAGPRHRRRRWHLRGAADHATRSKRQRRPSARIRYAEPEPRARPGGGRAPCRAPPAGHRPSRAACPPLQRPQAVIYHRPAPIVRVIHRHGGEHEGDAERVTAAASMTSQVARLYALVAGVLVFFLAWAGVASPSVGGNSAARRIPPRRARRAAAAGTSGVGPSQADRRLRWAVYRRAACAATRRPRRSEARRASPQPASLTCRRSSSRRSRDGTPHRFPRWARRSSSSSKPTKPPRRSKPPRLEFERLEQIMSRFRPTPSSRA